MPERARRAVIASAFHPELRHGGSQRLAYDLFRSLRDAPDCDAIFLAAVDDQQSRLLPSTVPITAFEGRVDEFLFRSQAFDPVWQKLCSSAHIDALREFFSFFSPDIVHFHHTLFFGVDMLSVVRQILPDATIVLTLHDFAAICSANACMVRTTDRSPCNSATPVRCHQCLPERQPNHFERRRLWFQSHLAKADALVCPTQFLIKRYVDWGVARDRLRLVPNGVELRPFSSALASASASIVQERRRNRFGFFGQLIELKGVHLLLRAVNLLRANGFTDFTLEINGDNLASASPALRAEFEAFMADELLRPHNEQIVVDNGPYEPDQIERRMSRLDWCIVPSLWWEAFALVISEAWSFGKPVICSDIGAMAERVTHERDGLLFTAGDVEALAATIRRAVLEEGLCERLVSGISPVTGLAEMSAAYDVIYREAQRGLVGSRA